MFRFNEGAGQLTVHSLCHTMPVTRVVALAMGSILPACYGGRGKRTELAIGTGGADPCPTGSCVTCGKFWGVIF
jgi:hypothetical protein